MTNIHISKYMFYDIILCQTMSELHLYIDSTYHILLSCTKVCLSCVMVCMLCVKVCLSCVNGLSVMVCIICEPCDVMSGMHDTCVHACTCALCRTNTSKHLSGLEYIQANPNLAKITASHFQVLNTQNAN